MDNNPSHQNIKYTKSFEYLSEAFLLLLGEKGYENISVKELVGKAGVSRAAFYNQFENKQDFADKLMDWVSTQAVLESSDNHRMKHFSKVNFIGYYTRFFNHILAHSRFYTVMLGPNGMPAFRARMRNDAIELWHDKFIVSLEPEKMPLEEQEDLERLYHYIASAHVGMVEYWLEGGMAYTPGFMASQLYKMTWQMIKSRFQNETTDINRRQ